MLVIRLRVVPKLNLSIFLLVTIILYQKNYQVCTALKTRPETKIDSGTVDMINITTSTPTPGRSGTVTHTTHAHHMARHHLMAKDSNPKFEFLNDSAWDRRNIEAFYMKHS